MSYSLIVENERGESLILTHSDVCDVTRIDGLSPSDATVNTSRVSGTDGSAVNSVHIPLRNIVLYLAVKEPLKKNRKVLYKFFGTKRFCTLKYIDGVNDFKISGCVEKFSNGLHDAKQQPQISIICPDPYFKDNKVDYISFSSVADAFEFPFSIPAEGIEFGIISRTASQIIDAGGVETGAVFHLNIDGEVANPTIYNLSTQEYFSLTGSFVSGDEIIINTQTGEKSLFLLRNGERVNILKNRVKGSKWLKLSPGDNLISFSAESGSENIDISVEFTRKYEGV